jgi:outer membrane receptor protein involved in Fe transport
MLRSSTRNYCCYQLLCFAFVNALAISVAIGFASRVEAQQQQNEQLTAEPQQRPQQVQQAPPVTAPPEPNPSPAASPVSQTRLPQIMVSAPKGKPKGRPTARLPVAPRLPPVAPENPVTVAQQALDASMNSMDQARNNLLPSFGASTYTMTRASILNLPQGENTPIDKLILQIPGVSYDSAVSNPNFHIRGEYANAQIRINGVVLPEGVSGLGAYLATSFIGDMQFLTGALPAEYGLRTAGVFNITTRAFATPGGDIGIYGGSRQTIMPSFDYGGSFGKTEYFVAGQGNWNDLGVESATPGLNAIHDQTAQGKFLGYLSTLLDDSTRFSLISGLSYATFQIPNVPNQMPLGDFPSPAQPASFNSTLLNENERDTYAFTIASLQKKGTDGDAQFALYSRYAEVHFIPDIFGDMVFNDVASDVIRQSTLSGAQFDTSYIVDNRNTLRAGFAASGEQTNVSNISTVMPGDIGAVTGPAFNVTDKTSLLGWNIGTYVQHEWQITNRLTLNAGLRFDQLYQFVDANQFSPRAALIYKPVEGTTIHAGYARYFTPPYQAQATQSNIALFANTTNQPEIAIADPVKPERAHYFDVGWDQTLLPGLSMGLDAYYKMARDMIDDGQFGQAVVLTQFNWARGYSEGGEFKLKYTNGNFNAYANFAYNISRAIGPESNQYLFDADEYAYLLTHYHYTDDMQRMTGSAGVSYRWHDTLFTTDLIYGSGLRSGELPDVVPNSLHTTPYAVVNAGIAQDFRWSPDFKPATVRFDVVNLFDQIYQLRDGTGIGVFAPQFGARRGYYLGLSQKL